MRRGAGLAGGLAALALVASACGGSAEPSPEPSATYEGGVSPSPTLSGPSATAAPAPTESEEADGSAGDQPAGPEESAALSELAAAAQSQASAIASAAPLAPRKGPVLGADISWPQCPPGMGIEHKVSTGQPLPTAEAEYVVIGLTNGPGFHSNPCLADQVAWARQAGLMTAAYAVVSFPDEATVKAYGGQGPFDATTPDGVLKNVGYAQALFNLASMREAGLASPLVWIDVEPVPHYEWSPSKADNAAVVLGAAQAYVDEGLRIGVYSTPHLWETVVGDLALGVPEWRAAGQTSMAEALSRCGEDWSIQGGRAVLGQWVQDRRDKNVTCPGVAKELGMWFAPPAA